MSINFLILMGTFAIFSFSFSIASGSQLTSYLNPDTNSSKFEVIFQRTMFIEYEQGGEIASQLQGKSWKVEKTADSTYLGVQNLIQRINQKLITDGSEAQVANLNVDYSATMEGGNLETVIDYKLTLYGELIDYTISARQGQAPAVVDMGWRGVTVKGPVVIDGVEINIPISAIKNKEPFVFSAIAGTEAEALLLENLIDTEGIKNQPLTSWDFLFDPTGINVDSSQFGLAEEFSEFVISVFTMGESSIREISPVVKIANFTVDRPYTAKTVQSADKANVMVIGFATIDILNDNEVFEVTPNGPSAHKDEERIPVETFYYIFGFSGIVIIPLIIAYLWKKGIIFS